MLLGKLMGINLVCLIVFNSASLQPKIDIWFLTYKWPTSGFG